MLPGRGPARWVLKVLGYSALQTGLAYVALTLAVIVSANVWQALASRFGIRRLLPTGCCSQPPACSPMPGYP